MTENTKIPFDASSDENMPDDIPLGNYAPLLVPTSLGQPFLQPKFIYPLGAVSLFNTDNVAINDGFEPLNNSFDDSPFFDQPLSPVSPSAVDGKATNQSNIQTKSLSPKNNLQRKQQSVLSSGAASNDRSIKSQSLSISPSSQVNELQRQPNVSSTDSISQGEQNIQQVQRLSESPVLDTVSQGDRTIQEADLNIAQTTQIDTIQRQSDTSTSNISQGDRNQQIQRFSELPNLDNVSQGDRTIQESESNITQIPQIDSIQRQSDISAFSDISQGDQNIQQFQGLSESPVLDTAPQSDRNIQREPDSNIAQIPQIDSIQSQSDTSAASDISQGDHTLQEPESKLTQTPQIDAIQKQSDTSTVSDVSQGDQQIQSFSESPVLDNASQGDHTIQEPESNVTHTPQIDAIQKQSDTSTVSDISQGDQTIEKIQRFSESSDLDTASKGDRTIQEPESNITQTPRIDSIQRQSDISAVSDISQGDRNQQIQRFSELPNLDNVSQGDRTIQEPDSNATQTPQIDAIQRQSDTSGSDISQGDHTLQESKANATQTPQIDTIQRQSDTSTVSDISLGDQTIEKVQRFSELPNLDTVTQGDRKIQREPDLNIAQIPQIDSIQRQSDTSDISDISQGDRNQQIQRFSELPNLDDNASQGDRTIQEPDSNITQTPRIDSIQRQSDTSDISDISQGDRNQQIQRFSELPNLDDNASQGDRTIQEPDSNITQTPRIDSIQRQSDTSDISDISQGDRNQQIQRFSESSDLDTVSQGDRNIQREPDLNIAQTPQIDSIQRQSD
ncbi:MAG: hypothetical protein DCF20_13410, partial [Pseudanabaena sp.]